MYPGAMNDINPYILYCGHRSKHNIPPPGFKYQERQVLWYELELIIWGEGYIITEGKHLNACRGDLFFRKPGTVVQGVLPYYSYLIAFDMIYDSDKTNLYKEKKLLNARGLDASVRDRHLQSKMQEPYDFPQVINATAFPSLENLFNASFNEFIQQKPEMQFFMKSYLLQILSLVYVQWNNTFVNVKRSIKQNHPKVMSVKKYIDLNCRKSLDLHKLSELANLSPNFLCKIFKDIVGMTLVEYINKSRINLSKSLLAETQKNIKEISFECGFENDTYFYTIFKRLEGISPAVYRKQHYSAFLE